MKAFYITTPVYYVNDVPHIGHAYTTIVGDTLSRYHRARGEHVRYMTGTDEHGQKIETAAKARGLAPKQLADQVVSRFQETWTNLNISHDDFIRTTEPRHAHVVQQLWQRMDARGDVYLGEYDGMYCVACEEYFTETQVADGRCPVHGTALERLKQPSYFFRMSRYQDALLDHFERHPDFVRPENRRNEIVNFIRGGLRDLSISRTNLRWGIRVPGDDSHVIYVWVDALTNYISGLGGFENAPLYDRFWPAAVHLIGKDILRFHAVYWPCMLLSAGLPLPAGVFAHGWWTVNGQKMSKTLANTVEPNKVAAEVGRDALRYFILRETPLGNDGDFSHSALIQRINAELANDLGNLVNRALTMAVKYCDGMTPAQPSGGDQQPVDRDLAQLAVRVRDETAEHFERFAPSRALESLWELVRATNKYIDTTAPFKLARNPEQSARLQQVMANTLESLRWIALMVTPAMPDTGRSIVRALGLETSAPDSKSPPSWPATWGELPAGCRLQHPGPLFPRIDDAREAELLGNLLGTPPAATEAPPATKPSPDKPERELISIDDVARLDLRAARVVAAKRVEGAKRLLELTVDLGDEQRRVVAGIAEAYAPEAVVGQQVILVANLQPATIRGVESQGMILAAGEKKVLALGTLDSNVAPGTKIR